MVTLLHRQGVQSPNIVLYMETEAPLNAAHDRAPTGFARVFMIAIATTGYRNFQAYLRFPTARRTIVC